MDTLVPHVSFYKISRPFKPVCGIRAESKGQTENIPGTYRETREAKTENKAKMLARRRDVKFQIPVWRSRRRNQILNRCPLYLTLFRGAALGSSPFL